MSLCQQISKQSKLWFLPIVICGCERWTIKKSECQRIDAFKLWCWRRLLRVLWTTRRLNQSILKEINPEYSMEGLTLRLKFQYFGHLMWRADSLEKTDSGKDWGLEEKGATEDEMVGWHHWLNGHEFEQVLGVSEGQGSLRAAIHGLAKSRIWLSNATTTISVTPLDFSYTLLLCLGCGISMQCLAQPLSSSSAFWITCLQTCSLVCSLPFKNLQRPAAVQYFFHMSVLRFVWPTHYIMSSPPPSVMKLPLQLVSCVVPHQGTVEQQQLFGPLEISTCSKP